MINFISCWLVDLRKKENKAGALLRTYFQHQPALNKPLLWIFGL